MILLLAAGIVPEIQIQQIGYNPKHGTAKRREEDDKLDIKDKIASEAEEIIKRVKNYG